MIFEASWIEIIDGLKMPAGFSSSHLLNFSVSQLPGFPASRLPSLLAFQLPGFPASSLLASWPPCLPAVKAYYF
jgi:hypothetical protein